ncbi:hypothetical protein UFOVP313_26 [uncultured Caudovirales phage]|uniref:Uncharacterized protein n=1 Tax=uncultured Caudovirales phage TaxID=2100421 RepID=A0A6J5LS20_9CAUD|nr:hypothetical protein UFOVP313_26 [uncultured Caudovirales phage]
MNIYRHGDVLLRQVVKPEQIKEDATQKESHVVAYGEATGHHHRLTGIDGARINALKGFDERAYVEIVGGIATLSHEEHSALKIEPGFYEITIEQEYDYFERAARNVID